MRESTQSEGEPLADVRPAGGAFARHAFIYGASSAAVAGVNFLLLPAFSRVLSPADYGLLGLLQSSIGLLVLLAVTGTNGAIQFFYFKADTEPARAAIIGASLAWVLVSGSICAALGSVGVLWISSGGEMTSVQIIALWVGAASVLPLALLALAQEAPRLRFRPWHYAAIMLLQALVTAGLGWWWVVQNKEGVAGACAASLGGVVTALVPALWLVRSEFGQGWSKVRVRAIVSYGAPFVPASLALWLFSSGPRWVLAHDHDLTSLGVFEIGTKIAAVVMLLNSALGQAFSPHAFRLYGEDPDYRAKIIIIFHFMCGAGLLLAVVAALFSAEFCSLMLPDEFQDAAPVAAVLAMGGFFSVTHQVTALGMAFERRTWLVSAGWGGTAVVCTALAYAVIPFGGAIAAAAISLFGYAGLSVFYWFVTQRLHPLPFNYRKLSLYVCIAAATLAVTFGLAKWPQGWDRAAVKVGFLLAMALVLYVWGGVRAGLIPARMGKAP